MPASEELRKEKHKAEGRVVELSREVERLRERCGRTEALLTDVLANSTSSAGCSGTPTEKGERMKRFTLTNEAPNNEVYGLYLRYGVLDNESGDYALLPNAAVCFGLTWDEALDALNELRGGRRAHTMRDGERHG